MRVEDFLVGCRLRKLTKLLRSELNTITPTTDMRQASQALG
jgi:hypothetical protein